MSSFFGKDAEPTADSGEKPLRTWQFFRPMPDFAPRTVEAHFIRFEANHVTFWRDRPEPNVQDTLILAEINTSVLELKEVIA